MVRVRNDIVLLISEYGIVGLDDEEVVFQLKFVRGNGGGGGGRSVELNGKEWKERRFMKELGGEQRAFDRRHRLWGLTSDTNGECPVPITHRLPCDRTTTIKLPLKLGTCLQ